MSKKKWFRVFFAAFIEAEDEKEAEETAKAATEAIEDYIGTGASADPLIYRVKVDSLISGEDGPGVCE